MDAAHCGAYRASMLLIGQYDSPFVRRVAIAMALRGLAFDHRPWSTFREADRFRDLGPLTKVPTLRLDDGTVLVDSHLILDWLEGEAPAGASLWPGEPSTRRRALALTGIATGTADVAVSLFYEKVLHPEPSSFLTERRARQVQDGLSALEAARAEVSAQFLMGEQLGHADIAVAVAFRFVREAHPDRVVRGQFPALEAFADGLEAMPVFEAHSQPFIAPA
jgi:glutathione S-transferase